MIPLWTAADAIKATGGTCDTDWQATGVSIDTRSIQPGDMFVALTDMRDGHDFVAQALEKGASVALVSRIPTGVPKNAPLLVVRDVLAALNAMAEFARARTHAKVVAVTGSVGKTSTKEMLRVVLSGQGSVHAAEKSFNNHWGVPLTLARMPMDVDFAVIEIGMNHSGEIAPLAKLTRPNVGMITNVAAVHLEAFKDVTGIAKEKATLFEGLEKNGVAVINNDLSVTSILLAKATEQGAKIVKFGQDQKSNYCLKSVTRAGDTTVAKAEIDGKEILYKIMSPGRHFALNGLGCLAVARALGLDLVVAACDLALWVPPAGRGAREVITLDIVDDHLTFDLLDDAFNANPASMAAALDVLAGSTPTDGVGRRALGRRIAVLGDMLELGPDEIALHAGIASYQSVENVDVIHCVGPLMRALYDQLPAEKRGKWFENAADMALDAYGLVDAGDVVLVKGSKGARVTLVVDAIRKLGHRRQNTPQGNE